MAFFSDFNFKIAATIFEFIFKISFFMFSTVLIYYKKIKIYINFLCFNNKAVNTVKNCI